MFAVYRTHCFVADCPWTVTFTSLMPTELVSSVCDKHLEVDHPDKHDFIKSVYKDLEEL